MQSALEALRAVPGGEHVKLDELVILGAQAKLMMLRGDRGDATERRRRLAQRLRSRDVPVDRAAAEEVRRSGWARP